MAEPSSFPAIRSRVGDWTYFNTTMRFGDIASRIQRANEIHSNQGLDDMIQRELGKRVRDIASYLQTEQERFFNAIVVGIYGGSPDWFPIDIEDNDDIHPLNLTERARESLGVLQLTGDERLFAVDGQHRVEGIKGALEGIEGVLKAAPFLEDEEIAVLFVGHGETPEGTARTRRLFTTLNKYAVPVTRNEIIALDEDDACAIIARMIVNQYDGLSKTAQVPRRPKNVISLVKFRGPQIPSSDRYSITTIQMLYKLVDILSVPRDDSARRRALKRSRPLPAVIDKMYEDHVGFWESLRHNVPSMQDTLGSDPSEQIASRYRFKEGGHILFRPVGQEAFARALRTLMDRQIPLADGIQALAQTQLTLDQPPWRSVMWDPSQNAMNRVNLELAESLLLFMVGQPPVDPEFKLEDLYRTTVGSQVASLSDIPRSHPLQRA